MDPSSLISALNISHILVLNICTNTRYFRFLSHLWIKVLFKWTNFILVCFPAQNLHYNYRLLSLFDCSSVKHKNHPSSSSERNGFPSPTFPLGRRENAERWESAGFTESPERTEGSSVLDVKPAFSSRAPGFKNRNSSFELLTRPSKG